MIEATNLKERYGSRTAVEDLTFTIRPGIVTGFWARRRRQVHDDAADPWPRRTHQCRGVLDVVDTVGLQDVRHQHLEGLGVMSLGTLDWHARQARRFVRLVAGGRPSQPCGRRRVCSATRSPLRTS